MDEGSELRLPPLKRQEQQQHPQHRRQQQSQQRVRTLPDELWSRLLQLGVEQRTLGHREVCSLALTCSRLRSVCFGEELWRCLYESEWPEAAAGRPAVPAASHLAPAGSSATPERASAAPPGLPAARSGAPATAAALSASSAAAAHQSNVVPAPAPAAVADLSVAATSPAVLPPESVPCAARPSAFPTTSSRLHSQAEAAAAEAASAAFSTLRHAQQKQEQKQQQQQQCHPRPHPPLPQDQNRLCLQEEEQTSKQSKVEGQESGKINAEDLASRQSRVEGMASGKSIRDGPVRSKQRAQECLWLSRFRERYEKDRWRRDLALKRKTLRAQSAVHAFGIELEQLRNEMREEKRRRASCISHIASLEHMLSVARTATLWQPQAVATRHEQLLQQTPVAPQARLLSLQQEQAVCEQRIRVLNNSMKRRGSQLKAAKAELAALTV